MDLQRRDDLGRLIGRRKSTLCTNLLFLCLFLMMLCGLLIVSALSYGEGNPLRVVRPFDCVYGFTCGTGKGAAVAHPDIDPDYVAELPQLFYYKPYDLLHSKYFCVPSCTSVPIDSFKELATTSGSFYCGYNGPKVANEIEKQLEQVDEDADELTRRDPNAALADIFNDPLDPTCAMLPIPRTVAVLGRCVTVAAHRWLHFGPLSDDSIQLLRRESNETLRTVLHLNEQRLRTSFSQNFHDLFAYWRDSVWAAFLAVFLGGVLLVLLYFAPHSVPYFTSALFTCGGATLCAMLWRIYAVYATEFSRKRAEQQLWLDASTLAHYTKGQPLLLDSQLANETGYLVLSILTSVKFVFLFVAGVVMLRRMQLCAGLFYEVGVQLQQRAALFFVPACSVLAVLGVGAHFYVTLAYTITSDRFRELKTSENGSDFLTRSCHTLKANRLQQSWPFLLVGSLWLCECILIVQRIVVANSLCSYYFTRLKVSVPYGVGHILVLILKHHVGSVASAALFMPLLRVPRLFFGFLRKRVDQAALASSNRNQRPACLTCCELLCLPCFLCEHSLLRYMGSYLLVFVATRGYDVLDAAYASRYMFQRNAFRIAAFANAAHFTLLLAKVSVSFTITAVILIIHQFGAPARDFDVRFFIPNVVFTWFMTLYLADCFISFFEAAVDSLLCCVCEDVEVNDGTLSREYLMSVKLMDWIRKASCDLDEMRPQATKRYSASVIIGHNLNHNNKYKKDQRLVEESRM